MDLNMLLYVVLFLIILALFLGSLVRHRLGTRRNRDDASIPGKPYPDLEREPEDRGE